MLARCLALRLLHSKPFAAPVELLKRRRLTIACAKPECPLCAGSAVVKFWTKQKPVLDYFSCQLCSLVFLNPEQRLTAAEEKKRYATHNNNPQDPRYRNFLGRLATPMISAIHNTFGESHGAALRGLDYGCGPGTGEPLYYCPILLA